jgi:uncharacterized protein
VYASEGEGRAIMILDMRPLLRGELRSIKIDYMLTPETVSGVCFDGDAHVEGAVTDNSGYMRLELKTALTYHGECARCLEEVDGVFEIDFERTVVNEGVLTEAQLEDNVDEYVIIKDGMLDIDEQLKEELLLGFPTKILCSEDCPGLCSKCGKPLRQGDCGCPKKEIDPRLAVLATLLDKNDDDKK